MDINYFNKTLKYKHILLNSIRIIETKLIFLISKYESKNIFFFSIFLIALAFFFLIIWLHIKR